MLGRAKTKDGNFSDGSATHILKSSELGIECNINYLALDLFPIRKSSKELSQVVIE